MATALFLFLSAVILQATSSSVPVLIWGGKNDVEYPSTSGLKKISTGEFSDLLTQILADKSQRNVVVFVQESLSAEDLGSKGADEKSAYPNLENELSGDIPVKYLPYVEKPVEGLNPLNDHGFQVSEFDDKKVISSDNSRNLLILRLQENASVSDRVSMLRNHDSLIHDTCSKIKEMDKGAICMLTGLRSSWVEPNFIQSRHLLESTESASIRPNTSFLAPKWGLFYTNRPAVLEDINAKKQYNVTFIQDPATGGSGKGSQKLTVTADINQINTTAPEPSSKIKLQFNFTVPNNSNHWTLDHIYLAIPYDNTNQIYMNSTSNINGWFNYSFHTPSPVVFNGSNYKLTFNSMQVELFNGLNLTKFSIAEDTVGFFTIPIWSGLFVTSLLITIVLVGLSLIYDIKTMDQFDDPKGKPLTINASD